MTSQVFDVVVIGSGPAGREAALAAVEAGRRAVVIEKERGLGGNCVKTGTIPSKTLRETAAALAAMHRKTGGVFEVDAPEAKQLAALMSRLEHVIASHERVMGEQLTAQGVEVWHGRARLVSRNEVEVSSVRGERRVAEARVALVLATGSRPRAPENVPIDHEHVLDSDSILSLAYLPESLTVLGGGVIASEYASVFAALGVKVTMIDRGARPLGFLDAELVSRFEDAMRERGATWCGGRTVTRVVHEGFGSVRIVLDDGSEVVSEKVLCALGRVANVEELELGAAGLAVNARGHVPTNAYGETATPRIYAAGDVAGPPALATAGSQQGRRAVRHALGIDHADAPPLVPTGVYTIPEIASVGMTETQAREAHGAIVVGRASFGATARGMIAGAEDGFLKLVASADGERVFGVHAVGENAAELVSVGQLAMEAKVPVELFVRSTFNYPTLVEAYRIAALDVRRQRIGARRTLAPAELRDGAE